MSKISKDINLVKRVLFAEESEKSIYVSGSREDEVEPALKKMGWVRTNELEDIPGEVKTKWQYSPKDNKDLIVALDHEFDNGRSVGLFIHKYLWDSKKKEWYQSKTGSGYILGYRIGRDSFSYNYGD